jgi:hypothetical protein
MYPYHPPFLLVYALRAALEGLSIYEASCDRRRGGGCCALIPCLHALPQARKHFQSTMALCSTKRGGMATQSETFSILET